MRACAFDIDVGSGRDRSIDRWRGGSLPLFTGSNVRGGWPQLAKHNLLAFGHRIRYRRDRHGHLPPRVSILFLPLFLSSTLLLDLLSTVFPREMQPNSRAYTTFIQTREIINPADSIHVFFRENSSFVLTSNSYEGRLGLSTWKYHREISWENFFKGYYYYFLFLSIHYL